MHAYCHQFHNQNVSIFYPGKIEALKDKKAEEIVDEPIVNPILSGTIIPAVNPPAATNLPQLSCDIDFKINNLNETIEISCDTLIAARDAAKPPPQPTTTEKPQGDVLDEDVPEEPVAEGG